MTCGVGLRTRSVNCEIFLQVSRTTAVLPDLECAGVKPASRETCRLPECANGDKLLMSGGGDVSNKIEPVAGAVAEEDPATGADTEQYAWRAEEMTACSAPCLGGKRVCCQGLFMVLTEARFLFSCCVHRNTGVGD